MIISVYTLVQFSSNLEISKRSDRISEYSSVFLTYKIKTTRASFKIEYNLSSEDNFNSDSVLVEAFSGMSAENFL